MKTYTITQPQIAELAEAAVAAWLGNGSVVGQRNRGRE